MDTELERILEHTKYVSVLFAPNLGCNLQCVYCAAKPIAEMFQETDVKRYREVLWDTAERTASAIERFLDEYNTHIDFEMHGYEPLLADPELFKFFGEKFRRYAKEGKLELNMQTNATLVTEDIAKMLRKYGWKAGVSVDGPREVHNRNRPMPGEDSYQRTMNGVKILRKYKIGGEGIISVITKNHMHPTPKDGAQRYYRWLVDNEFKSANLHFVEYTKMFDNWEKIEPSISEYIEFFVEVYRQWAKDSSGVEIIPFTTIINSLITGEPQPSQCLMMDTHCFNIIEITWDGQILNCDRNSYTHNIKITEVNTLEDILKSKTSKETLERSKYLQNNDPACGACKYWKICHGGCTYSGMMRYFDLIAEGEKPKIKDPRLYRTKYCPIYRILFRIIEKDLRDLGYDLAI